MRLPSGGRHMYISVKGLLATCVINTYAANVVKGPALADFSVLNQF